MTGPAPLLVVTTRSHLRTPARFGHMALASARIRRQLVRDEDVVRWASLVAGPSEFWTITVWRSRHGMQEFMRSGAHDDIMWLFSRWLDSFWLMRWRPTEHEVGSWGPSSLAAPPVAARTPVPDDRRELLDRALHHLPRLRAATGADGAAAFDATTAARRRRAEVADARALVVRLQVPIRETVAAVAALRSLRRTAEQRHRVVRSTLGLGRPGEVYLLTVWGDVTEPASFLGGDDLARIRSRWPQGLWAQVWVPENEFGNWDGVRLRRGRDRFAIRVPDEARALDAQP